MLFNYKYDANDVFEVVDEPSTKKLKGEYEVSRVENRRSLYEFAVAKHTDNPAKIEVGRPHDLSPASYEDTKKIVREESVYPNIYRLKQTHFLSHPSHQPHYYSVSEGVHLLLSHALL